MLALEDCLISSISSGIKGHFYITFSLPGIVNLYGIKKSINNYQIGHERFPNRFGVLYVACDYCVRYAPSESELYQHLNGFDFRSLSCWPEFKGREFLISGSGTSRIKETDDKLDIIHKIGEEKNLRPFLNSFFNWLNESSKLFPEFYKPLQLIS